VLAATGERGMGRTEAELQRILDRAGIEKAAGGLHPSPIGTGSGEIGPLRLDAFHVSPGAPVGCCGCS